MKTVEEAIVDTLIEGLEFTINKMKQIRDSWQLLPNHLKNEIITSKNPCDQIKEQFREDLAQLLNFELKDGIVIIRPRHFLGSENFAKIATIVRGLNGKYVSAGRESHFKVKSG